MNGATRIAKAGGDSATPPAPPDAPTPLALEKWRATQAGISVTEYRRITRSAKRAALRCLSCGGALPPRRSKYCTDKCRRDLRKYLRFMGLQ